MRVTHVFGFAAALLASVGASAQTTFTVPSVQTPTLEIALNPALSGIQPGDTIELLPSGVFADTYTVIVGGLTIRGLGNSPVVIDGFGQGPIFTLDFPERNGLVFENLRLINGMTSGSGGAIDVIDTSSLILIDCEFEGNSAGDAAGAIDATACNLTVRGCTFRSNIAGGSGGAIRASGGALVNITIEDSVFIENTSTGGIGGAALIANSGGNTVITDSVFSGNSADLDSGGVFTNSAATIRVERCDFLDNTSSGSTGGARIVGFESALVRDCDFERNLSEDNAGGLYSSSDIDVVDCRFLGNGARWGGGACVFADGQMRIFNCLFDGNDGSRGDGTGGGGGIGLDGFGYTETAVRVTNSLFINNTAPTGGAILASFESETRVEASTFWNNSSPGPGSAIRAGSIESDAYISNSILWGNTGTPSVLALTGPVRELGYCIVEGGYGTTFPGIIDADPMFADAPGGDFTLLPGSPAIDAGNSSLHTGPATDLGGGVRVADDLSTPDSGVALIGPVIDMGAFEIQSSSTPDCPADQNFDGMLSPADFSAWVSNYNAGCD